ncbi:MAG: protein kinase [Deltaproteobacteria bacterium]|nr:protein kinase [Deltaproteobacteria bacterium]
MAEQAPIDSPILAGVDPLIGQEVGGAYRIVRLIGAGGMGSVYEARHLRLNRRCAVKVLLHDLQADPTYLERFRREAEVTSRLRNRHICEVLDFNVLPDGSPYLAMEYLEGEDLATRIKKRPLTAKEMAPIIEGIGSALAAAHKIGVLHRDIKPANIFIAKTSEGGETAKLLDFGAAKRQGQDANLTATGQVLGSVWYVSPEQARGQELDFRTDIFSLGIVLYEGLTGRNPFEAATPTDTLFKIVSDPAPPIRSLVASLPPALEEVLARAMAKRREDRFASVQEFADAAVAVLDPTMRRKPGPRSGEVPASAPSEARPPSAGGGTATAQLKTMAERGLLQPAQLEQALQWIPTEGELLFDKLVQAGFVEERTLLRFIAGTSGYKYITGDTLAKSKLPAQAVAKLPAALAEQYCVAPLAFSPADGGLTVAIAEPVTAVLDELKQKTGVGSVQGILALRGTIRAAVRRFYPAEALSAAALHAQRQAPPSPANGSPVTPLRAPGKIATPLQPFSGSSPVSGTGPTPIPAALEPETFSDRRAPEREPDTAESIPDATILEPLQAAGLLQGGAVEQAKGLQRERGGFLGDALLRLNLVREVDFLRTFAELYGTRFVKSDKVVKVTFDQALIDQIPARTAEELRVLPFAKNAATNEIHVIAAVPLNPEIEPRVKELTKARAVTVYLASPGAVQAALRRWYYGDLTVLAEVTPNGAGPGPMRPRSTPGAEPEPERDASQKTVQVSMDDAQGRTTQGPAPTGDRALVELQKRLPLDGDPMRILEALLDVMRLDSAALVLDDGRKAVRGLRSQTGETVPRARIEAAQAQRAPMVTDDAKQDPLLGASRLVREHGVQSAITLPLLGRSRVVGALHIDATQPIRLQHQKDLTGLADLIALRIEDGAQLARAKDEQRSRMVRDRFLPPALQKAADDGTLVLPVEGQLVQVTLLYAQLQDFDDLAGRLSAPELVAGLNRTWATLVDVVQHHGGSLVELYANRLLALWSPALGTEGDAAKAVETALALQQKATGLQLGNRRVGLRIGLHSGLVTLGKLGTAEHSDLGVVGSGVKIAARMASLAVEGQVLCTEATLQRAGPLSGLKPIPMQTVQDLGPPVVAYMIGAPVGEEVDLS